MFFVTLNLNASTRHSYLTSNNYISVNNIKKHYACSRRLLKITLFSFEICLCCLATHKNKTCKEIEAIANFKKFRLPSLIDIDMSYVLLLGDIMHD